jgi:hypothetical protein
VNPEDGVEVLRAPEYNSEGLEVQSMAEVSGTKSGVEPRLGVMYRDFHAPFSAPSESDYLQHTAFPQYSCFHWSVLHLTHTYAYAMFLTHFIMEPRTSNDPRVILIYLDSL